jgi:site-specific recombinase XerD
LIKYFIEQGVFYLLSHEKNFTKLQGDYPIMSSIAQFEKWAANHPLPGRHRRGTSTTVAGYVSDLRRFARWFEQTNGLTLGADTLTADDIQDFLDYLQMQGYKPNTVLRYFAAIHAYCKYLQATGVVARDLSEGIRLPANEASHKRGLRRRERLALIRVFNTPWKNTRLGEQRMVRDRAIVLVLMFVGLRIAELEALTVDDIQVSERKGTITVREGKGNRRRKSAVPAKARRALLDWLSIRETLPTRTNALFVQLRGDYRPLGRRGIQQMIAEAGQRARLEIPLTPHVLRHTAVRIWREQTGDDRLTAKQMGHSVATMLRYDSLTDEDLSQAAESI